MSGGGPISRRDALTVLGGGVGVALSPLGAAESGTSASSASSSPPAPSASSASSAASSTGDSTAVRVTVGYTRPAGKRAARERARRIVYEFGFDAITVVIDVEAVEVLRRRDDVRYVERDRIYTTAAQDVPWGIDRVDADVVHGEGETGDGVDIAIIDTGIDKGHEDLQANLGEGTAFAGGTQHNQWQDDNGHGTHVAGTAAAVDNGTGVVGVAPGATLHAVKVLQSPGAGLSSDVAKGIEWVADQGYDVGNLSLTGDHLQSIQDACEKAHNRGVTLVGAAGNTGQCTDCVQYPAAYSEVIAVSATNRNDDLANFSSQGPEVDIAAPGTDIKSTDLAGYSTRDGTSMACPHVAGTAGLLAAHGYSNGEIRAIVKDSAEDVGLSNDESGAGLLDTEAALGGGGGGGGSSPPETATPSPTSSPTPTATETPTPSPTPTATETPTPSPTPTATETPTSSPTPTATESPTPSPTPSAAESPPSAATPTGRPGLTKTPAEAGGTGPGGPSTGRPRSGELDENLSAFLHRIGAGIGAVLDGFADAVTGLFP